MAELIKIAVYSIVVLVMAIVIIVLVAQLPNLSDGNVSGILGSVGLVVLILGIFAFIAVTTFLPQSVSEVMYWNTFMVHVVLLPLSLLGIVTATSVIADAKKTITLSGTV